MHIEFVLPIFAMFGLTAIVVLFMMRERFAEMRERRISLAKVASSTQMNAVLQNTRASDNYKNLFEQPVFFYVLCVLLATGALPASIDLLMAAWAYVALRGVHSAIHIGYNHVRHRFFVFLVSFWVLVGLWVGAVWPLMVA